MRARPILPTLRLTLFLLLCLPGLKAFSDQGREIERFIPEIEKAFTAKVLLPDYCGTGTNTAATWSGTTNIELNLGGSGAWYLLEFDLTTYAPPGSAVSINGYAVNQLAGNGSASCSDMVSNTVTMRVEVRAPTVTSLSVNRWGYQSSGGFAQIANAKVIDWALDAVNDCPLCPSPSVSLMQAAIRWRLPFGKTMRPQVTSGGLMLPDHGFFNVLQVQPSYSLYSPKTLTYWQAGQDAELIYASTNAFTLRQVLAADSLADIVTVSTNEYKLELYDRTNVLSKSGGIYQTTNSPYYRLRISNPDGGTNFVNLIEQIGSTIKTNQYSWVTTNSAWTLNMVQGLAQHKLATTYSGGGLMRSDRHDVMNTNLTYQSYSETRGYSNFSWGKPLVSKVVSPATNSLSSAYTYYTATNDVGYRQLKQITESDGNWSYFLYDSSNRVVAHYQAFLNQGFTTNTNLCRVTTYDYTPLSGSGDSGSIYSEARTAVEWLLGHEIARTYLVILPEVRKVMRATVPGAAWNATNNMVSATHYYTNGAFNGWVSYIENNDGTMVTYAYATNANYRTNITCSGQPATNSATVVDGVKNITVVGTAGQLIDSSSYDILSGIMLQHDVYSIYDSWMRVGRIDHLNGTYEINQYGCCGPDSTTSAEGVTTSYEYDELGRKTAETVNGIRTDFGYDANGNATTESRTGTDASVIAQVARGYDLSGRTTASTNALGGITTYAYVTAANGQMITLVTNADGGTLVTTNYLDGTVASITGTAASPMRTARGIELESGTWRPYTQKILLDSNANDTTEWSKEYSDMLGRTYLVVYADASGAPAWRNEFNLQGQLARTTDPDGVAQLFAYNKKGEQVYSALDCNPSDTTADSNGNFSIDMQKDRLAYSTRVVTNITGTDLILSQMWQYSVFGSSTNQMMASEQRLSTDGLQAWQIQNGATNYSSTTINPSTQTKTVTNRAANSTFQVQTSVSGRLTSTAVFDASGNQVAKQTTSYDPHGRVLSDTDLRNGTTYHSYNAMDLPVSVTYPAPGGGRAAQTVATSYDTMGRSTNQAGPTGTLYTMVLNPKGHVLLSYGEKEYPSTFAYDSQGRVTSVTNWINFASQSGGRVTTWAYDAYRGWVKSKYYPDGNGSDYTFTAGGRLKTQKLARSVGTNRIIKTYTYGFDDAVSTNQYPDVVSVGFNDTTPGVSTLYDRLGRAVSTTQNGTTTARTFNDSAEVTVESLTGGILNGLTINTAYDTFHRVTNVTLLKGTNALSKSIYTYDLAGRAFSIGDGTLSAEYHYITNSGLIDSIVYKQGSTNRMTAQKQYNMLNKLTALNYQVVNAQSNNISRVVDYNDINKVTSVWCEDGSVWRYSYDAGGQLLSGKKYWTDGTPVPGQQYEYAYDDAGNRTAGKSGGDSLGANLRSSSLLVNQLNQYTNRSVPNSFDVLGLSGAAYSVSVNGLPAAYRHREYYQANVAVTNSSAPVWLAVTVTNTGGASATGNYYIAQTPEINSYDLDGNTLSDGRWAYTWDAENRLTSMQSISGAPTSSMLQLQFVYDSIGRRIEKRKYVWNGSSYTLSSTTRYVYNGWTLLAELDSNNDLVRAYQWGLDLSGGLDSSGGVGALLFVKPAGSAGLFACNDQGGSVVSLVDAGTGNSAANYAYGPFGETIRKSGGNASMPVRYSSRYTDDESDLVYYGFRYYNPSVGRWLSREPLSLLADNRPREIYTFVHNDPVNTYDQLGLLWLNMNPGPPIINKTTFILDYQAVERLQDPRQWDIYVNANKLGFAERDALGTLVNGDYTLGVTTTVPVRDLGPHVGWDPMTKTCYPYLTQPEYDVAVGVRAPEVLYDMGDLHIDINGNDGVGSAFFYIADNSPIISHEMQHVKLFENYVKQKNIIQVITYNKWLKPHVMKDSGECAWRLQVDKNQADAEMAPFLKRLADQYAQNQDKVDRVNIVWQLTSAKKDDFFHHPVYQYVGQRSVSQAPGVLLGPLFSPDGKLYYNPIRQSEGLDP